MLLKMQHYLAKIVAERPITGFLASLGITGTGFWTFLEGAAKLGTALGGFLIMLVGLCAAFLNYRVQKLAKIRAELDLNRARLQESDLATSREQDPRDSSSP